MSAEILHERGRVQVNGNTTWVFGDNGRFWITDDRGSGWCAIGSEIVDNPVRYPSEADLIRSLIGEPR